MKQLSKNKVFGGWQEQYQNTSETTNCEMIFSIYLPQQSQQENVPVLYWLSGLTCTDQNFVTKAGAQKYADEHGIAIVCPDTSPRGEGVPDDPDKNWDFGLGAGFYVNATQEPWAKHYQMYDYVTKELPTLIEKNFPVTNKKSISGHSMGGHGALIIALKEMGDYQSISAFAPIVNPSQCPWGQKAFSNYLGGDEAQWKTYDACELIRQLQGPENIWPPLLVHQGLRDQFLEKELLTDHLKRVCADVGYPLTLNMVEDFDHSYFFIASFIEEHLAFHAKYLLD